MARKRRIRTRKAGRRSLEDPRRIRLSENSERQGKFVLLRSNENLPQFNVERKVKFKELGINWQVGCQG